MRSKPNDMSEHRLNNSTLFERTLFRSCTGYKVRTQFIKWHY